MALNCADISANRLAKASLEAYDRIAPFIVRTNLMHSTWMSSGSSGQRSCTTYLKLESEQHTNSFKVRGALNKVLSLSEEQLKRGLVTCSTGNHALAFLHACNTVTAARSATSRIYLPETASAAKVAKLKAQGANLVQFGNDCVLAELEARLVAERQGATYISPYNDWELMAGQGTVAVEVLQQIPGGQLDVCIVPVGGGGLIGGIAAVLKAANPRCWVVGAQPAASDIMRQSVEAGHIVNAASQNTFSDATAGGIEAGSITLDACRQYVDQWVLLEEQDIADAIVSLLYHHSKLVEGAAGCGIAAFKKLRSQLQDKRVVIVCCGGNIAIPVLQEVLAIGKAWS